MNFDQLDRILNEGTREELNQYCNSNNLIISDGKLIHKDLDVVKEDIAFWDKRQLVKKINLNSLDVGRVCQ